MTRLATLALLTAAVFSPLALDAAREAVALRACDAACVEARMEDVR